MKQLLAYRAFHISGAEIYHPVVVDATTTATAIQRAEEIDRPHDYEIHHIGKLDEVMEDGRVDLVFVVKSYFASIDERDSA